MNKLRNVHPGEILEEEFIKPLDISAYRLAKETNIPQTRISEIIKGKRKITADTALRFSRFFGNSPQFWLGLQNDYDLEEENQNIGDDLGKIAVYVPASGTAKRVNLKMRAKRSR